MNEKILEEYLRFVKLILIFMSITKKKQKNKLMKMKYRLSFTEYRLAVEIDEEKHADKKH